MEIYSCERCEAEFDDIERYNAHMKRKTPCIKSKSPVINNNIIVNEDILSDNKEAEELINEELPDFDIDSLFRLEEKENFSMILTASRRSGKTTLLASLYPRWQGMFDLIIFFSYSIHNKTYSFVKEPKFDDYNSDVIDDIFKFQKKTGNLLKILIVFDDLVSNKVKNDDKIMQAYVRGRNSNISVVVSTQIFKLISKNNRGNTDYIFIGKTNAAENRLTLIDTLLMNSVKMPKSIKNKTQKLELLDKWLMKKTENYQFTVIDLYNDNEKIYKYKVPL